MQGRLLSMEEERSRVWSRERAVSGNVYREKLLLKRTTIEARVRMVGVHEPLSQQTLINAQGNDEEVHEGCSRMSKSTSQVELLPAAGMKYTRYKHSISTTSSARLSFPISLVNSVSDGPTAPHERPRPGLFAKRHAPLVRMTVCGYIKNVITHQLKVVHRD